MKHFKVITFFYRSFFLKDMITFNNNFVQNRVRVSLYTILTRPFDLNFGRAKKWWSGQVDVFIIRQYLCLSQLKSWRRWMLIPQPCHQTVSTHSLLLIVLVIARIRTYV